MTALDLLKQKYAAYLNQNLPIDAVICGESAYAAIRNECAVYGFEEIYRIAGPMGRIMGMDVYVSYDLEPNEIVIAQHPEWEWDFAQNREQP